MTSSEGKRARGEDWRTVLEDYHKHFSKRVLYNNDIRADDYNEQLERDQDPSLKPNPRATASIFNLWQNRQSIQIDAPASIYFAFMSNPNKWVSISGKPDETYTLLRELRNDVGCKTWIAQKGPSKKECVLKCQLINEHMLTKDFHLFRNIFIQHVYMKMLNDKCSRSIVCLLDVFFYAEKQPDGDAIAWYMVQETEKMDGNLAQLLNEDHQNIQLMPHITKSKQKKLSNYIGEVAEAHMRLFLNGFIYLGIKAENILYRRVGKNVQIKLADPLFSMFSVGIDNAIKYGEMLLMAYVNRWQDMTPVPSLSYLTCQEFIFHKVTNTYRYYEISKLIDMRNNILNNKSLDAELTSSDFSTKLFDKNMAIDIKLTHFYNCTINSIDWYIRHATMQILCMFYILINGLKINVLKQNIKWKNGWKCGMIIIK